MIDLFLWKKASDVKTPTFGTSFSTCFDLEFNPTESVVNGYNNCNDEIAEVVEDDGSIVVRPGARLLIPTGLIVRLDVGVDVQYLKQYSIRLHARSGLALKRGLVLANAEGIVDADYQNEIFVLLHNISYITQKIKKGDRIAQAEIVRNKAFRIKLLDSPPEQLSDRNGGFGSTGVNTTK
jgi:dUTP pyrophosphatase